MTRMNFTTLLSIIQCILIYLVYYYTQNVAAKTCRSTKEMK